MFSQMIRVMNQAGEREKAGAVILNERLQREASPGRNNPRVPGKHSCFYSLKWIFFLQEIKCCFVLFCFPLRWDPDAMLESGFHPGWHFGQCLREKL